MKILGDTSCEEVCDGGNIFQSFGGFLDEGQVHLWFLDIFEDVAGARANLRTQICYIFHRLNTIRDSA